MIKRKRFLLSFLFLLFGILGLAAPLQAFQMDVSQVYYSDSVRTINYDFATGVKSGDIITIPAGSVNTTDGKTYTYGLFPGTTGMTLAWSPGSPCTLQAAGDTDGAAILATALPLPDISTAQTSYDYRIKLQNFTDMVASGKTYKFDAGMGSDGGNYELRIKGQLSPNGDLQLQAKAYGATGQDVWISPIIALAGMTSMELRIQNTGTAVNFSYNLNNAGWNAIGVFGSSDGYVAANYKGFPVHFPYAGLSTGNPFNVYSYHQQATYYAQTFVNDPGQSTYSSVSVVSSGAACGTALPSTALTYISDRGSWWMQPDIGVVLRNDGVKPACFPTYTITAVKKAGGQDVVEKTVTGYVEQFATNLQPTGNVATAPVFSWVGINGASRYRVELNDSQYNRIWETDVPSNVTSVPYTGPSLTSGQNYNYFIVSNIETGGVSNMSMATGSFTYTGATTITVSGYVRDMNGNVISSASGVGANGVFVCSAADCANKNTFASTETGFFRLTGLPANTPFMLRLYNQNYAVVFSQGMSSPSDIQLGVDNFGGVTPFLMPTTAQLTALGILPNSGKAVIMGVVSDGTYRGCTVGGVAMTAKGGNGSGKDYPVAYLSPFGVLDGSASATYPNGSFFVLNVDPADNNIVVTTTRQGWTFYPSTFVAVYQPDYPVSVSMGKSLGVAPSYAISLGGVVKDLVTQAVIPNANIAINGNPGKFTTSNAQGNFTLNNLPVDAYFYLKSTAAGYVPSYMGLYLKGSFAAAPVWMLTPQQMANNFGVTGDNGLLVGGVLDAQMNPLSGATVVLTSKSGAVYQAVYAGGGASTDASGGFYATNVQPGDVVKLDVTKAGYIFKSVYYNSFAGSVTQITSIADQAATLYADFTGYGFYKYESNAWGLINSVNPDKMKASGGTLYADFTNYGLYKYAGGTWTEINKVHPANMLSSGGKLFATFAGYGFYQYDGTNWSPINSVNPDKMTVSGGILYADFANYGLYKYAGGTWTEINKVHPNNMLSSDGKLYATFTGYGLYLYDGTNWSPINVVNPDKMTVSGGVLYADFANYGLYKYAGGAWTEINKVRPTNMLSSGGKLYATFTGYGFYQYDNATGWKLINSVNPESMTVSGGILYPVFNGYGFYKYDGATWTQINSVIPNKVVAGE